jgi:predicted TIM-barrel fold metal-dependent hydrolase
MAAQSEFRFIDADMHYYEPDDCFTRHLESKFAGRAVRVEKGVDGLGRIYFGQRRIRYLSVTPADFTNPPGSFAKFLAGLEERPVMEDIAIAPSKSHPEWVSDRTARLAELEEQGIEAAVMLPTLAVAVEYELRTDPEAAYAAIRAFNRWVEEDWGFGKDGRIFGVAVLSLFDREDAVEELERVIERGARLIWLRAGPVEGRSPADPYFDPFWARVQEAAVRTIFHIGNSGYLDTYSGAWSEEPHPPSHRITAFQHMLCQFDRPVLDSLAAVVLQNLFGRFPDLQFMSIENGSDWIAYLLKRMDKSFRAQWRVPSIGGPLCDLPSEVFRRHVSVAPFYEDDVMRLVAEIGADRVLFGSDYPHPEGVAQPVQFLEKVRGLSGADYRRVARSNTATLLGLVP